jgi:hypothetical protein
MAGSLSDWGENKVAEHLVGKTAFGMPTAHVALMTAEPGESNSAIGLSEVPDFSGNGYARVATAGSDWGAAVAGNTSNVNSVVFPQATEDWGNITHFALMTSPVWGEGFMISWGVLGTPKNITSGDIPEFAAGELDLTVT